MRLIDADALKDAIESTDWYHVSMQGNLVHGAISDGNALYKADDVFKVLDAMPAIDAVPVVRCPLCKYHMVYKEKDGEGSYLGCTRTWGLRGALVPDDFCSYGERKDGEG